MNEWEKAQKGYLYNAEAKELVEARLKCADLCFAFNNIKPSDSKELNKVLKQIIGCIKGNVNITPPFHCDYGTNIVLGNNFYANYNLVILDTAKVVFGDNVLVGPNCTFCCAGHAIDVEQRKAGLEIALPITVGDNVWFGMNVCVLPGVKIGNNSIIGAGSVVTKDIPDNVIAVGNPCRVLRSITKEDKKKYKLYERDNKMNSNIKLRVDNIANYEGDAVVNAANRHLWNGGGVCGDIFAAAGEYELEKECAAKGPQKVGFATLTSGCRLKAKYIIHAVGPDCRKDTNVEELLRLAYENTFKVAKENGIHSIALPCISTGIYCFPKDKACEIALSVINKYAKDFEEIVICFDKEGTSYHLYKEALGL